MPAPRSVAAALLAYAAATDNREVNESAAAAWADILDEHVTLADGKQAIIAHRRTSTDYLMPIHVNAGVRAIRKARTDTIADTEIPPAQLADSPARALAWTREFRRAIGDGVGRDAATVRACAAVGVETPLQVEGTHRMPDVGRLVRRVPVAD